MVNSPKF